MATQSPAGKPKTPSRFVGVPGGTPSPIADKDVAPREPTSATGAPRRHPSQPVTTAVPPTIDTPQAQRMRSRTYPPSSDGSSTTEITLARKFSYHAGSPTGVTRPSMLAAAKQPPWPSAISLGGPPGKEF